MSNKVSPSFLVLILLASLITISLTHSPLETSNLSDSDSKLAPEAWIQDWGVYVNEDLTLHSNHKPDTLMGVMDMTMLEIFTLLIKMIM